MGTDTFMSFCKSHRDILIFGYADVGLAVAKKVGELGRGANFVDNSTEKQGIKSNGDKVFSLSEVRNLFPDAGYVIASVWHGKQIYEQLIDAGVLPENIEMTLPEDIISQEEKRAEDVHTTPRKLLYFETNITKHCNLNCKGCDHFAPVASKEFLTVAEYTRDVNRLSELFDKVAERIVILGGEPLLHPQISDFLAPTRDAFPKAEIQIATNGTLIKQMSEDFWDKCRENKIAIIATRYPIKLDYDALGKFVKTKGVDFKYVGSSESGRTLWKFPLDLEGKQDPVSSFEKCRNANACLTLEHGRLYTCSIAPNIEVFNRAFGKHIELTDADGIDIYKAKTGSEILEAMARPMPFCRYCDVDHREYDHEWEVSKKSINEWT